MKNNSIDIVMGAILSINTAFLAFGGIANAALLIRP
jgi:nitrogenase molybdenum-iron protein alpha/beta subunit